MGWRPGKGIGPRLTKLDRKRKMASHNKLFQGKSTDENGEMSKDEENDFTEKYKVSFIILLIQLTFITLAINFNNHFVRVPILTKFFPKLQI
jgi:hypothetical protein